MGEKASSIGIRNIWVVATLIMICILFGAGFILTIWAIYMEAVERAPLYIIWAGMGTFFMTLATFIAIIQQKIERLRE
jgi:hypothetical protein